MECSDARKPMTTDQEVEVCKSYSAPGIERLSPADAKDLLLRNADAGDPEVQNMLDCVDELQGEKGS